MPSIELSRTPRPADQQAVKELFYAMPMMERGTPIMTEMLWVLLGQQDLGSRVKILPDYCYHIFEVLQKTYFKGYPLLSETVLVMDQPGMALAKTVEQAKKVMRIDWRNMGKLLGIAARCIRYAELEAADELEKDGFGDLSPEKTQELYRVIFGQQWVEANLAVITNETMDKTFVRVLHQHLSKWVGTIQEVQPKMDEAACQWSPAAMVAFSEGFTAGLTSFLDVDGQLAGETGRSGIYTFLLLAWPEIKAMLEAEPRRTLTDLHEWMKPFMRQGLTAYIEIDTLRDVCAPPPSGIGLALRPLKKIGSSPSA